MISTADAASLREKLSAQPWFHDFKSVDGELLQRYRQHYGLVEAISEADSAANSQVSHSFALIRTGGHELVAQRYTPAQPRGTVLLFHGYYDHIGLYSDLIGLCLAKGWQVLGIDLPGHGLSSGDPANIDSFQTYDQAWLDFLASAKPDGPLCAVGQSTGGAIIMDLLLHFDFQRRYPCDAYCLLAPLLRPHRWSQIGWLLPIARPFSRSLPRGFGVNSHNASFSEFLREQDGLQHDRLPLGWVSAMVDYMRRFEAAPPVQQALSIWQGTEDATVDWRFNLPRILDKFAGSEVHYIDGALHHLANESAGYRDPIFAGLGERLEKISGSA